MISKVSIIQLDHWEKQGHPLPHQTPKQATVGVIRHTARARGKIRTVHRGLHRPGPSHSRPQMPDTYPRGRTGWLAPASQRDRHTDTHGEG